MILENQILHPKKRLKAPKNTKNVSEKVKYMHFFTQSGKNLHLTENFYTDMSVVSVTNMRYDCKVEIIFWVWFLTFFILVTKNHNAH